MLSYSLASLIKHSPLVSVREHMQAVVACAREVPGLLEALRDGDQAGFVAARERISEKESEADRIKNRLRGHLPKSLFMSIDRGDLLEVLHIQDSIADTAEDIADLLYEREMRLPAGLEKPLIELAGSSVQACEYALKVIEALDKSLKTSFRGSQTEQVKEMVEELNLIEDQTDRMEKELARSVFRLEASMDAVSVMMWYRIIEWLGDLADHAEKMGDRVRLFIAR